MLSAALLALSVALSATKTYASELTSPFIFYSTAHLDLPSIPRTNPTSDNVHHLLSAALHTCPTTHYLVVTQPGISRHDLDNESLTPFLASLATSSTGLKVHDVAGQVSLDVALNTILMDCLHHGIKTVKQIDVFQEGLGVTDLDAQTIRENVIYAMFPKTVNLGWHDTYVEDVVQKYFGGEDYTVIVITIPQEKEEPKEVGGLNQEVGAEVPLVGEK